MRYRVYIKSARENLLNNDYLERGGIDNTGKDNNNRQNIRIQNSRKIPVKQNKLYQLMEVGWYDYSYDIFEYENENDVYAINNSKISINISNSGYGYKTFYKPKHSNANFIRFSITGGNDRSYSSRKKSFMFLESSDAILIHDSYSPEKADHLLNVNLDMVDSAAGNFTFTIFKNHSYYKNKINLWTDTIYITRIYKDGSERIIWDGRPINYERDSDSITYYCEGALGYFNDLRVQDTTAHDVKLNVRDFINTYIIDYKNDSIYYDRMDRTFFKNPIYKIVRNDGYGNPEIEIVKRDDNSYGEYYNYIDIDGDYKNLWALRRESGLKWLNDICESYGAHMKILYNKYDSPNDMIITRKLVMVRDFDNGYVTYPLENVLTNWSWLAANYVFWEYNTSTKTLTFYKTKMPMQHINKSILKNENYVKKQSIAISNIPQSAGNPNETLDDLIKRELRVELNTDFGAYYIVYNPDHEEQSYYYDSRISYTIYQEYGPEYTRIHTTFGIDVFDAKRVSEIKSFATKIIPRGAPCSQSISGDNKDSNADTEESNIFLTTKAAFVDGNFITDGIQGLRTFDPKDYYYEGKDIGQSADIEDLALIRKYGLVEAVVDFESANTPRELYVLAIDWFKKLKKEIIRTSIDISLTDFGQLKFDEIYGSRNTKKYYFYYYTDSECIDIWTQIYAYIPDLEIGTEDPSEHYAVVSLSIPLDDPLNTKITLANHKDMISDNVIVAGDIRGTPKGIIDSGSS